MSLPFRLPFKGTLWHRQPLSLNISFIHGKLVIGLKKKSWKSWFLNSYHIMLFEEGPHIIGQCIIYNEKVNIECCTHLRFLMEGGRKWMQINTKKENHLSIMNQNTNTETSSACKFLKMAWHTDKHSKGCEKGLSKPWSTGPQFRKYKASQRLIGFLDPQQKIS